MPDWQERITRHTHPELRAEHEVRYALAAPLIEGASLWCDLGCGEGVAAARALAGRVPDTTVLVDVVPHAVEAAQRELSDANVVPLVADLATSEGIARVRAALDEHSGDGARVVTCFEAIEHLDTFVPVVELLTELAERHGFTVLASVPNDAFWSIENPHHRSQWGEGAFEELRRLLPDGVRVFRQVALQGSAVVAADAEPEARGVEAELDPAGVPSHMIAVFGPRAEAVAPGTALVAQVALEEQRRWQRQRESDLTVLKAYEREFEDWRRYIHELEAKLGLPLSGEQAAGGNGAAAAPPVREPDQG